MLTGNVSLITLWAHIDSYSFGGGQYEVKLKSMSLQLRYVHLTYVYQCIQVTKQTLKLLITDGGSRLLEIHTSP